MKDKTANMDLLVNTAVDILVANPGADQDAILQALSGAGIAPMDARRLLQFVPMAFCHVMLRGTGVQFAPNYVSLNPETQAMFSRLLSDEPLYCASVGAAEAQKTQGLGQQHWLAVAGRSAEFRGINQLLSNDSKLQDIRLVEPVLFECTP